MQRHIVKWDVTVMVHPLPHHHHRWGIIIIIIITIVSTSSSWYHRHSIRSKSCVGWWHHGRIIRGDVWCCGDCGDGLMIAVMMMIHHIVVVVMGTIDMMQRWCVCCGGIGIGSSSGNGNHIISIIIMMIIMIHVHNFIPIQWYSR